MDDQATREHYAEEAARLEEELRRLRTELDQACEEMRAAEKKRDAVLDKHRACLEKLTYARRASQGTPLTDKPGQSHSAGPRGGR
jgi:hypothetical protein